jgi:hypothetical protein
LSKLGGLTLAVAVRSQKREESGVTTSSMSVRRPPIQAELELGVGDGDAARARARGGKSYSASAVSRTWEPPRRR